MPLRLVQLVYHSLSVVREDSPNLLYCFAALLNQCLHNNPRRGVTGVLAFRNSQFVQVLEGPEDVVEALLADISEDPRHHDLRVIARGECAERAFAGWAMGFAGYEHDLSELFQSVNAVHCMRPPGELVRPLARMLA